MSTADLIGHIVETHHEYLREHLPFAQGLAAKVARVHGDKNPKLREVQRVVDALAASLIPHLDDEEGVLFPAILAEARDATQVTALLQGMMDEHLGVAALLEQLRAASDDFTLPAWACTSYRTLFAELEQLEADIFTHVHLENHVLRPQALAPVDATDGGLPGRALQGPVLTFDLIAEANTLRTTLEEQLYTAKTLVLHPDFRVVMMVLRAGARIQAHKTDHRISLQGLTGHVHLNLPDRGVDLPSGGLVVLDKGIPHDVVAVEDSTVLLSIGGAHG
jgi:quercetin dioxygenase-like cupin family protein